MGKAANILITKQGILKLADFGLARAISAEVWPGVESLNLFKDMEIPRGVKRRVKERLKPYVKDAFACDLIDKLLSLDPTKRLDADNALNHDFFWTDPMPCSLERMLANHNQSMFEYLAPTRRGGRAGMPQPMQAQQAAPRQQHNEGYMDRVF